MRLLENSRVLDDILAGQPILPVLSITRESDILPMADALAAAGITNLEVTLRTPLGLGAIRLLASERPQLCVGAGTVLDARQFQSVLDAGARFIVTPGTTDELLALGRTVRYRCCRGSPPLRRSCAVTVWAIAASSCSRRRSVAA